MANSIRDIVATLERDHSGIRSALCVIRPFVQDIRRTWQKPGFSSAAYWESRYKKGGTSGVGSRGDLAQHKADVINAFVQRHAIESVIEFGCGDGHQLSLMQYPRYIGFDVSQHATETCRRRFKPDTTKDFRVLGASGIPAESLYADLAVSLDVIYHLVEDEAYNNHMNALFDSALRFVLIFSDDREVPSKAVHVRHRKFSTWISTHRPGWVLTEHIPNRFPMNETTQTGTWADFWIYSSPAESGLRPPARTS